MAGADALRDLEIDGDRDIIIDGGNDLKLTIGQVNIEQSISINVGNEVKRILGSPMTGASLENLREAIRRALNDDVQIGTVLSVRIIELNKVDNSVLVEARTVEDGTFEVIANAN